MKSLYENLLKNRDWLKKKTKTEKLKINILFEKGAQAIFKYFYEILFKIKDHFDTKGTIIKVSF